MNDFLVQFRRHGDPRPGELHRLAALLRNRPAVSAHPVLTFDFPWGSVALQPPLARGYAPVNDVAAGTLLAAVGRPRFMGVEHEQRGNDGFCELVGEKLRTAGPRAVSDALTGMFALLECGPSGVRVLTDPMAFMPVYVGHDPSGRVAAVGTHLDSVAELAGRRTDFDPVSLADLLVSQYVTFPYTTRRGVLQLDPASLTEVRTDRGDVRPRDVHTEAFWQPREPAARDVPSARELEAELESTLRAAAEDVVRGASRTALTLSGGLDSRLVLASLTGERLAGAITYATRENRELDVARRVAEAAGVPHHVAWRCEEFYAELMPRAVALLGTELRGECHGFCIADNGLDEAFDLIVGGFLSDTLFKGHYMSPAARERVRRRSPYHRARKSVAGAARAVGLLPPANPRPHYWDVTRNMVHRLRPDVRDGLAERHRVRLEQLRAIRPESAEEWVRFWPGSRSDGAYGPQANTRLFTADELFMHRRLLELAAKTPAHEKLDGRLTKRVFPRLYGRLGEIENSSTGIPAAAAADAGARLRRNGNGSSPSSAPSNGDHAEPSSCPWNDVQHSWVDYELLQKLSPTWSSYRAELSDSPAHDVLDGVLEGGGREFVAAYRDEAGFLFNRAAVQLTYALDRALRSPTPPAARHPQPAGVGCP
jgi:asparagine synthetase B (glutamine-hydrolysing)